MILYDGPSQLPGGARIVAIYTPDSSNRKTGPMGQVWILRADRHPLAAIDARADDAIAARAGIVGTTPGGRSCYVNVAWAPSGIWRTWQTGGYPATTAEDRQMLGLLAPMRLGAYGDPTAVPMAIWQQVLANATSWTGYTHFWATCDQAYRHLLMASVDNRDEQARAQSMGWRTFRVRGQDLDPLLPGEITCPASDEAGHKVTCLQCRLCMVREAGGKYRHSQPRSFAGRFDRNRQLVLSGMTLQPRDARKPRLVKK